VLARRDGALSAPDAGAPADVALRYVRANLAALGLRDLDTLLPPETETVAGVTTVRWRQAVDGVVAADSELRVNLDADGRVLNVLGAPAPDLDADTTPALTAGEAVRVVQDDAGVHRPLTRTRGGRSVAYDDGTTAALALYTGRLVWRVLYQAGADAVYDVMVDARTGRLLRRANLVKAAVDVRVWDTHPLGPDGGGTVRPLRVAAHGDPDPWLADTSRLFGRYVHAYLDPPDDNTVNPGDEVAPAVRDFVPFACAGTTPCSWSGTGITWTVNAQQNAIQAFYFANRFREHLATLGFDEFRDAGRLIVHASDGVAADPSQTDNAYMYTPPAPGSPLMQLQLWSLRNVNSGDDAAIVYHEYAHGLTSRRVVDARGVQALNLPQAGAMGEGWSDFYAQDFLDPADTATAGEIHMGAYVGRAIRAQPLDCPVGAPALRCPAFGDSGSGGFTYGDFGRIWSFPEVHYDGEIWAQTLWDVRGALGVAEARRVITGALQLLPAEPTFLEARDAMLLRASGDEQRRALWAVFARRGMGSNATTTDAWDTKPREGFTNPMATPTPTPTSTPTPTPTPTATPQPPGPEPTAIATAIPTAVPTPSFTPAPRPKFTVSASGRRAIKVRAQCSVACPIRATLTVDAKTAKRLGTARTVGTYTRSQRAGTTTFTVKLSSKVTRALRRRQVKTVKATLRVRSGPVTTSRKVTVRR
jgi:hypothetical protein